MLYLINVVLVLYLKDFSAAINIVKCFALCYTTLLKKIGEFFMKKILFSFFIVVAAIFFGFVFTGCGNIYGGYDNGPSSLGNGTLSGTITLNTANPSIKAQASGTPAIGAEVWVEEIPTLRTTTDSNGYYAVINVPAGNFHVVSRLISGGTTYKMRGTPQLVQSGQTVKSDIAISTAKNVVRGVIKNETGEPLTPGAKIWLWGESFTVDENGRFQTPPMPVFTGLDAIQEIIVNKGTPQEFKIPLSFVADEHPLEVDLYVPTTSGGVRTAPKVTLVATVNGKLCKKVIQGDQIDLTAMVYPENTTNLTWHTTVGTFSKSVQTDGNKRMRSWIAPANSGVATISVELKNAAGKSVKAFLPIMVEGIPNFFVAFDTDGGSDIASQTVVRGQKATKPATPTKNGYTFAGWFKDTAKTAAFDFTTETISGNTTVYAKWTLNPTYSVTYNGNGNTGGDVPTDSNKYEESATVTVSGNTENLVKTNFNFAGWNTKSDGSGTDYSVAATFAMGTSDVTLYAKWSLNSHTVTFNKNGGDTDANPATKTVAHGANVGTLPTAPTRANYGFSGWNTAADGSGTAFTAATAVSANITVYAQWTINTHTVTFNKNGGDAAANPTTKTAAHGANVGTLPTAPTRTGYTFNGWNTTANGTGTSFTAATAVSANITVYAQWTINTYTVTFDKNGGDADANPTTKTANHGGNVGTLPTAPTRTGYIFSSWNTAANGTGTAFTAATSVTANTTVYAQWTINTYTVTFDKNGGDADANPTTKTANHGANVGTLPTAPTRTGYTFNGWNTAANGTGTAFTAATAVTANITVYAQWTINTYTVTFDKNGGDADANPTTKTANHDTNVGTLPTAPTRTGYTFNGWNTAANGTGTAFTAATAVTANITVYAQWTINTYTVTFDKNGGDADANPTTKTANYNGNVGSLPTAPTRTGYTLSSWNTAANGAGTTFTAATTVTANITVYAQWTINTYTVTFNKNGGDTEANPTTKTANHGGNVGSLPTAPTKAGLFWGSWNTAADGSGTSFDASTAVTANVTVYAQYVNMFGENGSGNGQFNIPQGLCLDSSGNIYVADQNNGRVQKFDSSGNFIRSFGTPGTGNGQLSTPQRVTVDASGNLYVTENIGRVSKFDSSGNFLLNFGSSGSGNGQFTAPRGIDIDSSGNIFVADRGNDRIQKFDSSGNYVSQFGTLGSANGQLNKPYGMVIDSSNNIFVVDLGNNRIQKFDASGNFVMKFGTTGAADNQFQQPQGITVDSAGNIYVGAGDQHCVKKFDSSGNFISKNGSYGTADDQYQYTCGVAVNSSGKVYVVDVFNHRIKILNSDLSNP